MVFATGLLRPRAFTFPLPPRGDGGAHGLAFLFEDMFLDADCHLRSVDSLHGGVRLGEVTEVVWTPERATVAVQARCDRIMDYGDWVFTHLNYSQLDNVADGYGKLPGYGSLTTVAGPTATVRGGQIVDEGFAPSETIDDFFVPRIRGPIAATPDVRHFVLRYLVVLPAREITHQTAVALTFADTPPVR